MIIANKIAVVGAGIMGSGIAQVAAQSGYQVNLNDLEERFLERALKAMRKSLELMERKGKLTEPIKTILAKIHCTTDFEEAVREANLVIEAVPEILELKKEIFQKLDRICPPSTVLATNTSSISITTIASVTRRPEKVIGIHFSQPVPIMGVEIIRGSATSEETLQTALELCQRMGRETFIAKDFPGFVGNRLFTIYINEAFWVLWQGIASAEDIDKCAKNQLRHPMGPFEVADFVGLDTMLDILEYLHQELDDRYRPCPLLKQLVAAGRLGRKTGHGVYKY